MPWFAPSSSHAVSFSRWRSLLRTAIVSGMLAGSLSACVPLVIGGVVGGLLLATDRRISGAQVDDEAIELRGDNRIRTALQDRGRVSVTSYNRIALLTGQVPAQSDRDLVEASMKSVPNIRYIVNEITVGPMVPQSSIDALITARVKTVLVGSSNVKSTAVKVITEKGVVYLMGIATQQESDRSAAAASGVNGVVKVVKVFEIVGNTAISNHPPPGAVPTSTPPVSSGHTSP